WSKIPFMYAPKYLRELAAICRDADDQTKVQRLARVVDQRQGHILLGQVEQAKIDLSDADQTEVDLSFVEAGLGLKIARASFEAATAEERRKIQASIQECLCQAGVAGADIRLTILTGGGTGIPAIQNLAREMFPN